MYALARGEQSGLAVARAHTLARTRVRGGMRVKVQKDSLVGMFALDAGGVSGCAWWTGKLLGSIKETLNAGEFGFAQIDCGRGTVDGERRGAEHIAHLYNDMAFKWTLAAVPVDDRYLLVEDFIIRQRVSSKQRVGLSSPRIVGLVEGMLVRIVDGANIARYSPSRTKTFATNERLRNWGLWCRGAEHSRDAARLIALHIAVLLG